MLFSAESLSVWDRLGTGDGGAVRLLCVEKKKRWTRGDGTGRRATALLVFVFDMMNSTRFDPCKNLQPHIQHSVIHATPHTCFPHCTISLPFLYLSLPGPVPVAFCSASLPLLAVVRGVQCVAWSRSTHACGN